MRKDRNLMKKYIKDISVKYIITLPLEREYEKKLKEYIKNNQENMNLIFKNEEHSIYEIEKY